MERQWKRKRGWCDVQITKKWCFHLLWYFSLSFRFRVVAHFFMGERRQVLLFLTMATLSFWVIVLSEGESRKTHRHLGYSTPWHEGSLTFSSSSILSWWQKANCNTFNPDRDKGRFALEKFLKVNIKRTGKERKGKQRNLTKQSRVENHNSGTVLQVKGMPEFS